MSKKIRIRITQPGVYFHVDGEDVLQEVGTEVEVSELPLWAAGKYVEVGSSADKALIVNTGLEDLKKLQAEYDSLSEIHVSLQGEFNKLRAEVDQMRAEHGAVKGSLDEATKNLGTLTADNEDLRKQLEASKANNHKK